MSHNTLQHTMITITNMKQYDTIYNDIKQKRCYNMLQFTILYNTQWAKYKIIYNRAQWTIGQCDKINNEIQWTMCTIYYNTMTYNNQYDTIWYKKQ